MISIRDETPRDQNDIRCLVRHAFSCDDEAELIDSLRADHDLELSLVALDNGDIIGHIAFSTMTVSGDGQDIRALALAPVAVSPTRQREGIGSALIKQGLAKAVSAGAEMVFVLGDPDYYNRFGFTRENAKPFACVYAGPYFQACLLGKAMNLPNEGKAVYAPGFAGLGG
ncbi:MAG: N-acetyltransferase [Sphingobium sp.]|nr:N-acetyltransferase [Sphingobium sp.]MCP5398490.1 N-acetyltransferase [Sphingomonas sp.]